MTSYIVKHRNQRSAKVLYEQRTSPNHLKSPTTPRIPDMSFLKQNPLTHYTTPPSNYIGSSLFLSYIVAALYLSSSISYSLYKQYTSVFHSHPSSPPSKFKQNGAGKVETRNARVRHIKIYTALALISFLSISWHMLGFLITSFLDWSNGPNRNVFAVLSDNGFNKLKRWMLETSLFNDFAVQLVGDGESTIWTQLAVLTTWAWNVWMGGKGTVQEPTARRLSSKLLTVCRSPVRLHSKKDDSIHYPRPELARQFRCLAVHHPAAPFSSRRNRQH